MRKAQKKEAESFIILLEEAHKAVSKAMEAGKNYIVQDLLEQCQEGAIKLGELIESAEGERFKTIPLLEDYCELVYQIYEKAGQAQTDEADTVHALQESLAQTLAQIKDSVEHDIEARTEIVFLPYKASMWDSLESVWKAAEEDSECDAYVIPIPYFDKNPDGSFKEAHYEGDQYPAYVPVTDYNDYNFEARRPDVIYIHNPYDNCNHVTSVHPFFYSDNLKKFTDKLVYIPYFILGEVDPEDEKEVEWVQNYCMVPGVFHADKVIVQSEAMRQIYINVLTKEAGESSRPIWEEKILGLGSPKIDKVLCTKKEDLEIPEDWLRIIEKPDGSWKKIIFYNTGVAALLKHDEKMLDKMKSVFKTFKENQDEVALLWRPHPLIKATIESMRPQLWQGYQKIVEQYKEEGWGIYDDTPDMDRAVVLGDAYYGDGSSIVQLYRTINKSVLIQDVEVCNEEDAISICPYAMCVLNNDI